jgi:tetratricopeptide (TPR) repeat protein
MKSAPFAADEPAAAPLASGGGARAVLANLPAWFWPGLLLVLATVAAFAPVFWAGFIWDDDAYVTGNTLLTTPDGWWRIWFSAHFQSQYFPLVYTTLRMEYMLWGLNPLGYHAVNLCLHLANALLVWGLLQRLKLPGAWLAAAIFALHPVQVETVAWVTELKNTESTFFYLLAVFAWLNFCGGRGGWFYGLALALHALALCAKTTACTLPAALWLVLWLRNEPVGWRRILQLLPFLCLGFGMGLLSVWWEKHLGNYEPKLHLLGGPLDRLLIATHALWFYAGKIFWPGNLTFSYPRWEINAGDWRQYLWCVAGLAVAAGLWLGRRQLGRRPAAALLFFAAALSPMLGFIPLYTFYFSYVADHYQYLACLGPIALAAGALARFFEIRRMVPGAQMALVAMLLLVLGVLTFRQCEVYRGHETLWTDTVKKNPQSWMAHANLARLRIQQGRPDAAEQEFRAAIGINPNVEGIHYNLGNLLAREERYEEAMAQYYLALEIAPDKAEAHNNLGVVLNRQHRSDEAIVQFKQAIFYEPAYADAYYNLGNAFWAEHKLDAAVASYAQAVRLNPEVELYRERLQAVTTAPK